MEDDMQISKPRTIQFFFGQVVWFFIWCVILILSCLSFKMVNIVSGNDIVAWLFSLFLSVALMRTIAYPVERDLIHGGKMTSAQNIKFWVGVVFLPTIAIVFLIILLFVITLVALFS
jgi:hypothetical protein